MVKWKCRSCGGGTNYKILNMGESPLVNSLVEEEDLDKQEKTYPLELVGCTHCHLVQTKQVVDSQKIYQDQDYLYFTGDMPQESQYMKAFDSLVEEILGFTTDGDFIVEIGSNDGTILSKFAQSRTILGVDPAVNVAIRALARGIPTLSAEFNRQNARNIVKEAGKAQVVGGVGQLGPRKIAHDDTPRRRKCATERIGDREGPSDVHGRVRVALHDPDKAGIIGLGRGPIGSPGRIGVHQGRLGVLDISEPINLDGA